MVAESATSRRTEGGLLRLGQALLVVFGAFLCASALALPAAELFSDLGIVRPDGIGSRVVSTAFQFVGFGLAVLGYLVVTNDWGLIPLRRPTGRDALLVVAGIVGLLAAQFLLGALLQAVGVGAGENQVVTTGRRAPEYLLYMIPVTLLLVGPAEELLFRGVVQGLLRRALGAAGAIAIASAVFGLVHVFGVSGSPGQQLAYAAIAALLGGVLGYVYERTGNILVPSVIHGGYNAVLFVVQYAALTGAIG
ncbi:CPBP family intramembrane glutamic endopeptidase [Halegenticoccus tardaugens]|uniref:CPBP family intramembrane glutamic endopeptidase n=1 Tax=Halegenticoccus tardaugens TaxID=2071624 RepID=UPI0013E98662|nr:CPBP family intramembrane glutamic endopeptidase [Halegenticoccus tardaugens]